MFTAHIICNKPTSAKGRRTPKQRTWFASRRNWHNIQQHFTWENYDLYYKCYTCIDIRISVRTIRCSVCSCSKNVTQFGQRVHQAKKTEVCETSDTQRLWVNYTETLGLSVLQYVCLLSVCCVNMFLLVSLWLWVMHGLSRSEENNNNREANDFFGHIIAIFELAHFRYSHRIQKRQNNRFGITDLMGAFQS